MLQIEAARTTRPCVLRLFAVSVLLVRAGNNGITDVGAAALADALKVNAVLTKLSLGEFCRSPCNPTRGPPPSAWDHA